MPSAHAKRVRQQLRPDQWMMLDALHGQSIECMWVNWELYAELTRELSADDRSDDEEMIYPLFVEVTNIPIVMFGSYFGISERWVAMLPGTLVISQSSEPRNQKIFDDRVRSAICQLAALHCSGLNL